MNTPAVYNVKPARTPAVDDAVLENKPDIGGDKTDIRAYERFVREHKLRGNILIACVAIPIFVGYFIFAVSVFTGNK